MPPRYAQTSVILISVRVSISHRQTLTVLLNFSSELIPLEYAVLLFFSSALETVAAKTYIGSSLAAKNRLSVLSCWRRLLLCLKEKEDASSPPHWPPHQQSLILSLSLHLKKTKALEDEEETGFQLLVLNIRHADIDLNVRRFLFQVDRDNILP